MQNELVGKKIGFLVPSNIIAGGVFVVYLHANYLLEIGCDVTIIFENFCENKSFSNFKKFDLPRVGLKDAFEIEYDVVIATWWDTVFSLNKLKSKTYLYFVQSDERRFYETNEIWPHWVASTYLVSNLGIITEAKWIKNFLEKEFQRYVEYAPNGVDNRMFSPVGNRVEPKGNRLRVLIEGPADVEFKKVHDAFLITNSLRNEIDFEVWYVNSSGEPKKQWEFDRIFYSVPFSEMPSIYRSCDILIKVSSVEGFFGPPLEMMACGGTCLVSNVTGYDEYVKEDFNAAVISIGDVKSGVIKLRRLLTDSEYLRILKENAVKTAQKFDWLIQHPKFAEAIMKHYRVCEKKNFNNEVLFISLNAITKLRRHYGNQSNAIQSTTVKIVIVIIDFIKRKAPFLVRLVSSFYKLAKKVKILLN